MLSTPTLARATSRRNPPSAMKTEAPLGRCPARSRCSITTAILNWPLTPPAACEAALARDTGGDAAAGYAGGQVRVHPLRPGSDGVPGIQPACVAGAAGERPGGDGGGPLAFLGS